MSQPKCERCAQIIQPQDQCTYALDEWRHLSAEGCIESLRQELSSLRRSASRAADVRLRVRGLLAAIADPGNDPRDDAADGVSLIDVWRREAADLITALAIPQEGGERS